MAADRGRFIDQSQSMNLFIESPTMSKLSSLHFYAWKKGLKTGMYYLRSRAAADAVKFTVDPTKEAAKKAAAKALAQDKENAPVVADAKKKAAMDPDMEEEALMAAKLACSIENKDDCVMCGA